MNFEISVLWRKKGRNFTRMQKHRLNLAEHDAGDCFSDREEKCLMPQTMERFGARHNCRKKGFPFVRPTRVELSDKSQATGALWLLRNFLIKSLTHGVLN